MCLLYWGKVNTGFINGSKLYLKNPQEVFKGVSGPEDKEILADHIFCVGFCKRAFSKISKDLRQPRHNRTGPCAMKMGMEGGNKGCFSQQRGATMGTPQGSLVWGEEYCTQGPGE